MGCKWLHLCQEKLQIIIRNRPYLLARANTEALLFDTPPPRLPIPVSLHNSHYFFSVSAQRTTENIGSFKYQTLIFMLIRSFLPFNTNTQWHRRPLEKKEKKKTQIDHPFKLRLTSIIKNLNKEILAWISLHFSSLQTRSNDSRCSLVIRKLLTTRGRTG